MQRNNIKFVKGHIDYCFTYVCMPDNRSLCETQTCLTSTTAIERKGASVRFPPVLSFSCHISSEYEIHRRQGEVLNSSRSPTALILPHIAVFAFSCFPFSGPGYPELYKNISKGVFRLPDWLSPAATSLVRGMLITDPTRRFNLRQVRNISRKIEPPRKGLAVLQSTKGTVEVPSNCQFPPRHCSPRLPTSHS